MTSRPAPDVVEVSLTGLTDCDLCTEHYVWECPRCDQTHDHFQESDFPIDVSCTCGATMRITAEEERRWRQRFGFDDR
jgi:hypothetical protein